MPRALLLLFCLAVFRLAATAPPDLAAERAADYPTHTGRFEPTTTSLQQYACPEWFRDAKFGIYVHWGVYSVAEMGEWYGREMYQPGTAAYAHHLATYGPQSRFGYKDLIPLWHAEHFNPDAWLDLFKAAGARYFTPVAAHHDGFALWDSKYQPFNSVRMGPHRDIIGELRAATLRHGLRFGVTTHFDRTINWLQPSHDAATTGPLQGVPYDGNNPAFQDLYLPKYYDANRADPVNAPTFWREYWLQRMKELIAGYQPDFIYLDSSIPFAGEDHGATGIRMLAHFYNSNAAWHAGAQQGVVTYKTFKGEGRAPYFPGLGTIDYERTVPKSPQAVPFQTDDSIGPWGYNKTDSYKDARAIIHKLADVVSKNGNYLLNVPPRADGTFDTTTTQVLAEVGAWLRAYGEAIYGTRPWRTYAEGPAIPLGSRALRSPWTAANVRYTQNKDGNVVYAILLGGLSPGQNVVLHAIKPSDRVQSVTELSAHQPLKWMQSADGLRVIAQNGISGAAIGLKIGFSRNNRTQN